MQKKFSELSIGQKFYRNKNAYRKVSQDEIVREEDVFGLEADALCRVGTCFGEIEIGTEFKFSNERYMKINECNVCGDTRNAVALEKQVDRDKGRLVIFSSQCEIDLTEEN